MNPSMVNDLEGVHEEYKRSALNSYEPTLERLKKSVTAKDIGGIAGALSEWLSDFNRQYYRFRPEKGATLRRDLEPILRISLGALMPLRDRSITTLTHQDRRQVSELFDRFRDRLGPVGTAKALHVLAPGFFPLWDNSIAKAHGLSVDEVGYYQLMLHRKKQVASLPPGLTDRVSPLKLLDERDYLTHTLKRRP